MASEPRLLSPALQQAWDEARQALDAARQRCSQHGLDPDGTRAELERQLSALELADVYADVEAHVREVLREVPSADRRAPHMPALHLHRR